MQVSECTDGQQEDKEIFFARFVLDSELDDLYGLDHFGLV